MAARWKRLVETDGAVTRPLFLAPPSSRIVYGRQQDERSRAHHELSAVRSGERDSGERNCLL